MKKLIIILAICIEGCTVTSEGAVFDQTSCMSCILGSLCDTCDANKNINGHCDPQAECHVFSYRS